MTIIQKEEPMTDLIDRKMAIDALGERPRLWTGCDYELGCANQYDLDRLAIETVPSAQPEQRWIPCGKCIHADGKHRWCKVLDRTINEDYFCYWAEPFRGEGETE